jgi:hypothetical protein
MMTLATVLRRHSGVRFRVLNDEAVVLHQGSAEVMVLDAVATRILSLADGVSPISRWAEILLREFEVPPDVLERDILDFAEELLNEGLLESVSPAEVAELDRAAESPASPALDASAGPAGPAGPAGETRS